MSANTNLDNCECEANLFLKKYKDKIEGLFQGEKKSLKIVSDTTADYGTFKARQKEATRGATKFQTGIQDIQLEKPGTIEKSTATTVGKKSGRDKPRTDIELGNVADTLGKGLEKPAELAEGMRQSTVQASPLNNITETEAPREPIEETAVDKTSHEVDSNKTSKGETGPGEIRKRRLVACELIDKDKREFYDSGKYREKYDKYLRTKDDEQSIMSMTEDRRLEDVEVEIQVLGPKVAAEDAQEDAQEDTQEDLQKDKLTVYETHSERSKEAHETKIKETLKYLCDTRIASGEEFESERDYIKLPSRSATELGGDVVLFKEPDMHRPDGPVSDSQTQAEAYLKAHRIYQFFHFLMSHLVAANSRNPISYLISLLDKCVKYRAKYSDPPLLFQKKHIESLFVSMDPMQSGFIDINQYHTGMMTLGIAVYKKRPAMTKRNFVPRQQFVEEALKQLTYQLDDMIKTAEQPSTTTLASYKSDHSTQHG